MHRFSWSPGIGDPTFVGWLTVALYLLTSWLSWRITRRLNAQDCGVDREKTAWRVIAVMFLFLGVNKQLDLQTGFTELGRVVANAQGWYDRRFDIQIAFIGFIAGACFSASLLLAMLTAGTHWPNWRAVLGTILVLGYVVIRAASFHHVDWFIGQRLLGVKWNWILEIGGISIVLFDAARRYHVLTESRRVSVPEPNM